MRHIYIILLIIALSPQYGATQNELKNKLSLNWGIGNLVKQNITFSPLIQEDWSPLNFKLTYNRSNKMEHQASIRYSNYKSQIGDEFTYNAPWDESAHTYPHNMNIAELNYSLGKSILNRDQLSLTIGGKSRNRFDISDYVYGFSGTAGNYLSLGLNIWMNFKYKFTEKHQLNGNISLPIIAYVYRSPYLTQNDDYFEDISSNNDIKGFLLYFKRGEIQSWNKAQNFDFDLAYNYTLSERWGLGFKYWFSVNMNQKPTKYASIENVLYLSLNYKF